MASESSTPGPSAPDASVSTSLHDCDLVAFPGQYPGPPAPGSGLLSGRAFTPLSAPSLLERLAREPQGEKALVLAVGSNACPGVLHRKLAAGGARDTVPFLTGILHGCAVGHSAHVSVPGYVAAAPYRDEAAATPVYATLLDAQQLACVDRTEPNYVRRVLAGRECRLGLDGGIEQPGELYLYDSRWGVLAPPDAPPLALRSQAALHDYLRAHWKPYGGLLAEAGLQDDRVEDLPHRLAAEPHLRTRIRETLRSTGWSRPSGLTD